MEILKTIFGGIGGLIGNLFTGASGAAQAVKSSPLLFTAAVRWIFILLAVFILLRTIIALLKSKSPSEVWAYLHLENGRNIPVTHWENAVGRAKSCDIRIPDMRVSRSHGTLVRDDSGNWSYMDLGSRNGAVINGKPAPANVQVPIHAGDELLLGGTICTLFPVSIEEHMKNVRTRVADTRILKPWLSLIAITVFQILTVMQLHIALGPKYSPGITVSFLGLAAVMWAYVIALRSMKRKGFEIEIIAFFLSSISLAVVATVEPAGTFKQFVAVAMGVVLFFLMCSVLRNLERTVALKYAAYGMAAVLLVINMVFATAKFGATNWVQIGGLSLQPSEIVKLAFVWVGAATMDELFQRRNSMVFTGFAIFCFLCLAKMRDFGTAVIFFVTFLVISFLRSGDFTKLILIVGVAFVGGLLVLRFRSYVAQRFAVWGHVWQDADARGYQQTRTMSAAASGGLVGVGPGNGWLKHVGAARTDLVFGLVSEEWGMIIAILLVLSIITLSIFAYRSIMAGRSTYYTIAACAATTIFLFQTILNVFGSVDLLPLTGVTFPFVSGGGTSMLASWGLLAFVKAADTRQNASFAVTLKDRGLDGRGGDE